ncbi:hypothetical protein [Stigmatella aurantiaca]|uniref:hypothetical protein n=1 Tax=Stigmatella aurantiaca TaxID=41 RepID=UPI001E55CC20|nr:hypothetical protein [Stigmatella aurantiaca]
MHVGPLWVCVQPGSSWSHNTPLGTLKSTCGLVMVLVPVFLNTSVPHQSEPT